MSESDLGILKELRFFETGYDLILVDYEIQSVLNHVPDENLEDVVGDVTGCVVKVDNSKADFAEIWITDSTFAPSLNTVYERVR